MASAQMHPDAFAKLKKDGKDGMKARLASVGLSTGGNKPNLLDRYKKWWNAQSGETTPSSSAGPSVGVSGSSTVEPPTNPADTAIAPEPVIVTILDTSNDVHTVPLLERVLVPSKLKLSAVTLDCLNRLRYSPGAQFRKKAPRKDFSQTLHPLLLFVDMFLKTLRQVNVTSEMGENETALRWFISEDLREIRAPRELTAFFAGWNIKVVPEDDMTPIHQDTELNTQLALALEASKFTAQSEAEQRQTKDHAQEDNNEEAERNRKLLLQELDVVNCAIQYRLVRWAATFPQRTIADQLWPSTFPTEERKSIRSYVLDYVDSHDLIGADISNDAQMNAIEEMQNDDDFPVAMARSAAVIQTAFLENRLGNARRSRSQSQVTQTPSVASRNPSPVKGVPRLPDGEDTEEMEENQDDDDGEGENLIVHGKKRSHRNSSTSSRVNDVVQGSEDAYMDHQSRNTTRAHRRFAIAREIARNVDDGEQAD